MAFEDEQVEYKRCWNKKALQTVIAFANTDGGNLYLGLDDDGGILGVPDADLCQQQAMNALRDAVYPDITLLVSPFVECLGKKDVIRLDVLPGIERPYYLAAKGPCPAGVFVRQGPETAPASTARILQMMREDAPGSFEELESKRQDLTFEQTSRIFAEKGLPFGEEQRVTLGFFTLTKSYSNLAWLLSDQCTASVKCAVFKGDTKSRFVNRLETSGSLLAQLEQITDFLSRANQISSYTASDWSRVDTPAVPPEAYREAVLNLLVHQDYAVDAPGLISVFDHSIELLNVGGLPRGITIDMIRIGTSKQRNTKLASVFYRLGLVEAYGTGIPKILEAYRSCDVQPTFTLVDNAFKINLPSQIGHLIPGSTPLPLAEDKTSPVESGSAASLAFNSVRRSRALMRGEPSHVPTPWSSGDFRKGHRQKDIPAPQERGLASQRFRVAKTGTMQFGDWEVTWAEYQAVELAQEQGVVRRAEIQERTKLSQASVINLLRSLVDRGIFRRIGGGRSTRYELAPPARA